MDNKQESLIEQAEQAGIEVTDANRELLGAKYLTVQQIADLCGLHWQTVYDAMHKHKKLKKKDLFTHPSSGEITWGSKPIDVVAWRLPMVGDPRSKAGKRPAEEENESAEQ